MRINGRIQAAALCLYRFHADDMLYRDDVLAAAPPHRKASEQVFSLDDNDNRAELRLRDSRNDTRADVERLSHDICDHRLCAAYIFPVS